MNVKNIQQQMVCATGASPSIKHRTSSISPTGFTLLELILVMVILSTVLALSGPSLRGFFASRKTQDAAAQILALTQLAQTWAVNDGNPVRLSFDDKEQSYWLTVQKGGTYERLETEVGQMFFLPPGTEFDLDDLDVPAEESGESGESGETFITFTPQSIVTPGIIRLIDRRGYVVKIISLSSTEAFFIEVLSQEESQREN
ncbi:GspH/FimT family pseudopilin [Planctomycetota bacterium]